ncbi:MAG: D-2-hydroxyacid dehydrogenase [Clostridiales bacterium]|jgi:phosphoglycerate dehydrogenase-like enzyme|nr:D-2-hydroxyacid dehydrogenase [Clostridiales bacterium]
MTEIRKIGVAFPGLNEARLAKIRAAATGFEIVCEKADNVAAFADCEVIFGNVTKEVIQGAKKLKWLHTQTAGVDLYVRPETGLDGHVLLTNSSGAFGIGIAEHLVAMALMLLRKMGEYAKLQMQAQWKYLGRINTLYNSVVTVVGIGDIGSTFAQRCKAMGAARVYGVSRTPRSEMPPWADGLFCVGDIDEAIKNADIVALCLPGTAETAGLFDKSRLAAMKKGAMLLNVGRGTAVDQDALIDALKSGHVGSFGADVTNPEPLPADSPLWRMPNVIITPHVSGGDSLEMIQDLITEKFARYLVDYAAGRPLTHVVNPKIGY